MPDTLSARLVGLSGLYMNVMVRLHPTSAAIRMVDHPIGLGAVAFDRLISPLNNYLNETDTP